jgi:hypothetical protein
MNPIQRPNGDLSIACPYYEPAQPDAGSAGTPPLCPLPSSELDTGGGGMLALAELLMRADESDRKDARHQEDVANQAEATEDTNRVNAMLDKAQQDLCASVVQGAGEIVGGACTATAGFAAKADPAKSDFFKGCGDAAPGIGKVASAVPRHDADNDDATAARHQAAASVDERLSKEAHEDAQSAVDSLKKVEEFLQAVQQSKNAADQAAASFRA